MKRIIKIGMDVHTSNYTLCALEPSFDQGDTIYANIKVSPDYKNILSFIKSLKEKFNDELDIQCGYEAGCLGYSLYHQLNAHGIKCVILAPTTMKKDNRRVKTDLRDSIMIAQCLAYGGYKAVHIPTVKDNAVKEYLRMRDDQKNQLKMIKQQILAFLTRNGKQFENEYWTKNHLLWMKNIKFEHEILKETLDEYLLTYNYLMDKIDRFDEEIKRKSNDETYKDKVKKLGCFIGIKEHTALSLIVETSDFTRFLHAQDFSSYLGLVPGENSSSDNIKRLSITKAGNSHLRKLLVESANSICRGNIGYKSKALKSRQKDNLAEVISYADKANERLRRKYYKMIRNGKKSSVAKTAIARELSCFIWGMMTNKTN